MNDGLPPDHASILYYDGDYPWRDDARAPGNFDSTVSFQGLAHDVERYLELAADIEGPVLDLCCGTGRVAIPLAQAGRKVVAVDISRGQLDALQDNLSREAPEVAKRVEILEGDVTALNLGRKFDLAITAFNSFLCITSAEGQLQAMRSGAAHLTSRGRLTLDLVNPLKLSIQGDAVPKPFFTRINPRTGQIYTRFAMSDPFDEDNRQRLHGWYDELDDGGHVTRSHYSMHWRPIFLPELKFMLEMAGLEAESVEGGHQGEPFTAQSSKLFVIARLAARAAS